jgi:hypothetical protein
MVIISVTRLAVMVQECYFIYEQMIIYEDKNDSPKKGKDHRRCGLLGAHGPFGPG